MYPMTIPTQGVDFTSVQGPGDDRLPSNEVSGYSLVSRVGEVVVQAFVDTAEFGTVPEDMHLNHVNGSAPSHAVGTGGKIENKPMYHDWATVTPGMLTVARKDRTDTWRRNLAAEAATPVTACASCLTSAHEKDFFFAGVARTKSIIPPDDGIGPQVDEFFTLFIGGQATILNTSGSRLSAGDWIAWTFDIRDSKENSSVTTNNAKRVKLGNCRRIGIKKVPNSTHPKCIGRAMGFAKTGETFDVLLKQ